MKRRRVKITGIGPVTPAGIGREEFWKGILEPVSRVRPFSKLGPECGPFVAASIDRFNVAKYLDRERLPKGIGRHTQFAAVGAVLALRDAGISSMGSMSDDCVVVTGSSLMDFGGISNSTHAVHTKGPHAALPRTIFTTTNANVTETVSQVLGVTSRTMTLQNSCCSGLDAIGYAAALVARGEAEIAVCGGTEAPLYQCPLLELRAAGLTPLTEEMSDRLARPFDLWRTTGVISEGASMFVLEPESSPRKGYSFVAGYGFANDETSLVCSGLVEAARLAIADAKIKPNQVEAISAWGPGHRFIDAGEASALLSIFHDELGNLSSFSIKGAIGSALGAAGAIQVAASALAQFHSEIPPTVNWRYPDPMCPLNLSNRSRMVGHRVTLINTHGVGSVNSCLVLIGPC
ncbi:MAG TPA: beta-ketoacyl synthase N-terminal-like domain-containing protein [Opitutaceae bacterium]|nr:beta-ketoacyl synthase N-terminal-like domain-containing protein [Opitutaceae bacterium]